MVDHPPSPPERSRAALEAALAERDRRLRELTDQALGLLDQLTEARARTEGGRQQLERRVASLEEQLRDAERRVRRADARVLRAADDAADPQSVAVVCWGDAWQPDDLVRVARDAEGPVLWLVGREPETLPPGVEPFVAPLPTIAHAWNHAVSLTTTPWIALLGPGQVISEGTWTPPPDADPLAVLCPVRTDGARRTAGWHEIDDTLTFADAEATEPGATVGFARPEAFVLRRAAYREVGAFDEGIRGPMALAEWTLRARARGLEVVEAEIEVAGPAFEDPYADRDRLVALARHRPDRLGAALARADLLWAMPGPELRDFVRGLIARTGDAHSAELLTEVLTGLCTHTLPDRDAVPRLRAAAADLHRSLRHELQQLPEALRTPLQIAARGAPTGGEPPAALPGWLAAMARATLDARLALATALDEARAEAQRLAGQAHDLRLNVKLAQNATREAQQAHDNALAAIESVRQQVAQRDQQIAQRDERLAQQVGQRDERIAVQGAELERLHAEIRALRAAAEDAARHLDEAREARRAHEVALEAKEQALHGAEERIRAAHARLEQQVQQSRHLELELEEAREREADAERRLREGAERREHDLESLAEAIGLERSTEVDPLRDRLREMQAELGRFRSALEQSGENDPEALVERVATLRAALTDREQWIGRLLEELAGRRIKLRTRGLQPHEQAFVERLHGHGRGDETSGSHD